MASGNLVFALNGETVSIPGDKVDPTVTLNDFIRRSTRFKGTKLSCGEGGCGACAVDLSRVDPATGKEEHVSVNSCLRPLAACDGWAVTTTEGIGESETGFHPVQERIAGFNGSQCGFCTPGMVMTMYSSMKSQEDMTMADVEKRFDGNLCRCTGYRPILDACKSFAKDADIEDLVCQSQKCGGYDHDKHDPKFPDGLKSHSDEKLVFAGSGLKWIRPTSLAQVFEVLKAEPNARLVGANTSTGIYKEVAANVFVDVHRIAELNKIESSDAGVTFGAAVTITKFMAELANAAKSGDAKVNTFAGLVAHSERIANVHVRNVGTIAGNLVMAKSLGFVSDLATILLGVKATVTLATADATRSVSLEEFLAEPNFAAGEILQSVTVPYSNASVRFGSYKTALRAVNSHAYVNAAFRFELDGDKITDAVIAYGGVMEDDKPGSHAVRATTTEGFLKGKTLDKETVRAAINSLKQELKPVSSPRPYRESLVTGFFYKFLTSLNNIDGERAASATKDLFHDRGVSKGKQSFKYPDDHGPVSKAIMKVTAPLQASGEARYVDDLPVATDALFGALLQAAEGRAKIVSIDAADALKMPGVAAFITAKDIKGKNNFSPLGHDSALFADERTQYNGQPIGVIVADTLRHAEAAVKLVKVQYDREGKNPVITHEQAFAEKDDFVSPVKNDYKGGDVEVALKEAKHTFEGKIYVGTQKHFYMEPQSAYVVPEEDGSVHVFNANQWPDACHTAVAQVLGVPLHHVRIMHRRAGGGFGGKLTHNIVVAAAAAVAAKKTKRPVRIVLSRNADMRIAGGREETRASYKAGYDDEGKLTALVVDGAINGGWEMGLSWFGNFSYGAAINQTYYLPNFNIGCQVVMSNLASRTPVRGPGEISGSYTMETILERVAHELDVDPIVIREKNFYPEDAEGDKARLPNGESIAPYTFPRMWKLLKEKANYDALAKKAAEFNAANRWKKMGVSMTPVRYQVSIWAKSAMVNIYGDGSVIVSHGGAELGQGLNTKVSQLVAYELGNVFGNTDGIDLHHVRIGDTDTNIVPNATFTGGSTGSEGAGEAARRCCATLIERLKPVLADLQAKAKEDGKDEPITWVNVCAEAKNRSLNLSAQDHWAGAGETSLTYQNYGAAVSVVELDVLTGETEVRLTHMMYDCGKSLNPAIDIGQAEGAFLMGLGHVLRERVLIDTNTAKLESDGTWEYKIPCYRDVPGEFTVEFLQDAPFNKGILSSKASGEPPLVLACSVATAVRGAIRAARADAGNKEWFDLPLPMTVDLIQSACGVDTDQFAK